MALIMKLKRIFLVTELLFIFIYYLMTLFSIIIQPFNLIFGFIIVFILPGYNLLKILKPDFSFIEKLGYVIIVSLAIENIFMLFSYIILYNYTTYPETTSHGFIFNSTLLITAILFVNIILIIINEYKYFKSKKEFDKINERKSILNLNNIKEILNIKVITILAFFGLSLIFLCISTTFSNVPNNDYLSNYSDYRSNFTFFYRVPLVFYMFLITSILCLVIIIFYIKNPYIILISISIFIYCLWILPYLQINNFFAHDAYNLSRYYEIYLDYGIMTYARYNFVIPNFDSLRYSTSLFTTILLITATNCSLNFALWYLYPFLYIFLPFFFYSILNRFSENQNKNYLILIISVIFIIFTPQFSKYGHGTGTGVFGILVYFILVVEFYDLIKSREFNVINSFFIVLLFFFLCLTHTEECFYFIFLIVLSYIYYLFIEFKEINGIITSNVAYVKNPIKKESFYLYQILQKRIMYEKVKKNHIKFGILLFFLILSFYFSNEFFGYIRHYFLLTFGKFAFLEFIYEFYQFTNVKIFFFLRGALEFSIFVLISTILGVLLFSLLLYILFFKKFEHILKIYNNLINYGQKIFSFIIKLISKKIFQISFFLIFFTLIIFLNLLLLPSLEETLLLTIITLILSYSILILQLLFFIKGLKYYKLKNDIQNFFLLAIITSSIIMGIFMGVGSFWLAIYVLHTKFLSYFIFFNLIIIQNTYLQYLREKKYNFLICMIILVLILGTFYGLRTLAYG